MNYYPTNPYQKHLRAKEEYLARNKEGLQRTSQSLIQALEKSEKSFIMITGCQLICLSRKGALSKFALVALNDYLNANHAASIARIQSEKSLYIVIRNDSMRLQTDDELMIEPGKTTLCEQSIKVN
jgi:hypothetical protein